MRYVLDFQIDSSQSLVLLFCWFFCNLLDGPPGWMEAGYAFRHLDFLNKCETTVNDWLSKWLSDCKFVSWLSEVKYWHLIFSFLQAGNVHTSVERKCRHPGSQSTFALWSNWVGYWKHQLQISALFVIFVTIKRFLCKNDTKRISLK